MEMMGVIRVYKMLGLFRGMEAVDWELLGKSAVTMGDIGLGHEDIQEIDVNPMIVQRNRPVPVDALLVLKKNEIWKSIS